MRTRLQLERLEERLLLSTLTVNSTADSIDADDQLTLREAIAVINDGDLGNGVDGLGGRALTAGELAQIDFTNPLGTTDEVRFDAALNSQAILLSNGQLDVTQSLAIIGNGAANTIIDAQELSRILDIDAAAGDIELDGLTLRNGRTTSDFESGGAIRYLADGTLTIRDSVLSGNATLGGSAEGGAIATSGALAVSGSTFSGNFTTGEQADGGAIYAAGTAGWVSISGSSFTGNSTATDLSRGGAIAGRTDPYEFGPDTLVLTISSSTLSGNSTGEADGGAVSWYGGNASISDSTFEDNSSGNTGGAIESVDGNLTITGSTFSGNRAAAVGGGAITSTSFVSFDPLTTLSISDSTFVDNAVTSLQGDGGAVDSRGDLFITDSSFIGNSAAGAASNAGAVQGEGNITITGSLFDGNAAGWRGGALAATDSDATLTIVGSTFTDNWLRETFATGGAIHADGDLVIRDSLLSGNNALAEDSSGGAIYAEGNVVAVNSTISGNEVNGFGGGLYMGGNLTAVNLTVTGNSASQEGGGLGVSGDGLLAIHNSIVAGNSADDGADEIYLDDVAEVQLDVRHSLIGYNAGTLLAEAPLGSPDADGNLIGGAINGAIDPLLGPLQDNGGATFTHAPLAGSPALDGGDDALAVDPVTGDPLATDQRGVGFARILGAAVDMGAVETLLAIPMTYVVDTAEDESDGDYSEGDLSLREAVELANANLGADTITFATSLDGTDLLLDLGQIEITDAVTIQGNGAGSTTIDAQQSSRIFDIDVDEGNVLIDAVTLQNGLTTGDEEGGAAIRFLDGSLLTIQNSVLSGNTTTGRDSGGGAVQTYSYLNVDNTSFIGNATSGAYAYGGAVHAYYSAVEVNISNSTFRGNAVTHESGYGGAVYSGGSFLTISGSEFHDNTASYSGGAISGDGGIVIESSTLTGNSALQGNGGAVYSGDDFVVRNSTFSGNMATGTEGRGGAIYASGDFQIVNSTLSGNSAVEGGGIVADYGDFEGVHLTVTQNSAIESGGGILVDYSSATLRNSIVAGNSAADGDDISAFSITLTHSLLGNQEGTELDEAPVDSPDADGNLIGGAVHGIIDPLLGPLQDNGGSTFIHALLAGSAAIDAGDNALSIDPVTGDPLTTDQRGVGFDRILGGTVDMGAFESLPNASPTAADDSFLIDEDAVLIGNLITGDNGHGVDADADGDALSVVAINGALMLAGSPTILPSGATLTVGFDGSFEYAQTGAFNHLGATDSAVDTFTYAVSDGNGGTATATVTITIDGVNDDPAAVDNAAQVSEDASVSGNVLTDPGPGAEVDSDPDGDSLTLSAVNGSAAAVGEQITLASGALLTVNADGGYTYDANGQFGSLQDGETAVDTFTYSVSDGQGGNSTATVTITVEGANDAPIATDDAFALENTGSVSGNLITSDNGDGADSDPESDPLLVVDVNGEASSVGSQITLASGALLTVNADGSFAYDPNGAFDTLAPGASATDGFNYTVSDGQGGFDTARVELTVTALSDRGDVQVAARGRTLSLISTGPNLELGVDLDIAFTAGGVEITALNGTTINGMASLHLEGVDTLVGRLGRADDFLRISGEADRVTLILGDGENEVFFQDFTSARVTTVTAVGRDAALDFGAEASSFQTLNVRGSQGIDTVALSGVQVERNAIFALFGGENAVDVQDSQFERVFTVNSSGPPPGSLDFHASDSQFERLNILGSRLDRDTLEFDAVSVSRVANINLFQGLSEISVRDSTIDGQLRLSAMGGDARIEIENDSNGVGTRFGGSVVVRLGGSADLLLSATSADETAFDGRVTIIARTPPAELEAGNVSFGSAPKLKNVVQV